MTRDNSGPGSGRAQEEWAKAYATFLGLVGIISLILLARGLYLAMALLSLAIIGAAVLVRRIGRHLR